MNDLNASGVSICNYTCINPGLEPFYITKLLGNWGTYHGPVVPPPSILWISENNLGIFEIESEKDIHAVHGHTKPKVAEGSVIDARSEFMFYSGNVSFTKG